MIERIISGGQTGAERAALDVAIKLGIPHGGWVPKGRTTEEGPLLEEYQMQEIPIDSYPKSIEQNVIDSDATLIISHGLLTGGYAYAQKMAMKHCKPWFHIDLYKLPTILAAMLIKNWIPKNGIKTLNVAGPSASKDPAIYELVTVLLELVYNLEIAKEDRTEPFSNATQNGRSEENDLPETLDETIDILTNELSLKDKNTIAKLDEGDLTELQYKLKLSVKNRFLYPRNEQLLESCRFVSKDKYLNRDQASAVIIRELRKRLWESHKLRVV